MEKIVRAYPEGAAKMISLLKQKEICKDKWDDLLLLQDKPRPYAFSWYLDIMSPEWSALVVNDYEYICPLPEKRKMFFSYLATPVFLQALGVYPTAKAGQTVLKDIYRQIEKKYVFTDFCSCDKPVEQLFEIQDMYNYVLPIGSEYKEIWENYGSDCRRNIRIAREYRYRIEEDLDAERLINLFISYTGKKVQGVSKKDYRRLASLIEYCTEKGIGETYGIKAGKDLIFGIFLINHSKRITLLFTAGSRESRAARAGYLVTDHIIHKYAGKDYILDFAGSSVPSIASYIRSYGSREEKYYRLYLNNLPRPFKRLKPLSIKC